MSSRNTSTIEARATWRQWAGLAVLALPTLLVSLDVFVMLLALPQLSTELGAGSSQQLWIMDVYGFMVAGFMITMGTVGDRIGRRKLLLIGAVLFGAASVFAAYATSPAMLIAARAVLGVAGAALSPSTLSLITNLFPNPKQRASAIGIWAGCFVVGGIIGPVVGGAMLAHFWWGSVFLLGVPAMGLLLVLGPVLLPEYRDPAAGRLDLTSVALSLAAILPVIYGLKELARHGWQPLPVVALALGVMFAVLFARRQNVLADPLLDLRLFTNPQFSTTLGGMLAVTMLSGATMVFIAQHFQLVDGLSPLQAGLALLPGMVTSIVSFQLAPLLARRVRPANLIGAGLAVTVGGLLVITQSSPASGPTVLMIGFAITCLGAGPLVGLGVNLVVGSVPPEKAGSASGVVQTGNEFGYALGIAVMGSIGTAVYRTHIADKVPSDVPAAAADAARDSITGAITGAGSLPEQLAAEVLTAAREAFTSQRHTVAAITAAVLTAVAILTVIQLRRVPPLGQAETQAETPTDEEVQIVSIPAGPNPTPEPARSAAF
jgi:MFS transporter, DHA2 family, multidrug resistance protein